MLHFSHKLRDVGIEVEPGVFKKGDDGIQSLVEMYVYMMRSVNIFIS